MLENRGGDFARPSFDDDPSAGDFDLVANGDPDDTNISNAERFAGEVDGTKDWLWPLPANGDTDLTGVDGAVGSGGLCDEGRLLKEDLAEEKMFLPLTEAKGVLEEA